ncbi:MAG: hypothetical protein ABWX85_10455 [Arthrobacter sp.]
MTELNHITETDPDRDNVQVAWPANRTDPGKAAGDGDVQDPAVDALLDRLGQLRELPVAQHGEVYAGLHDELLAALNEPVAGQEATGQELTAKGRTTTAGNAANGQA